EGTIPFFSNISLIRWRCSHSKMSFAAKFTQLYTTISVCVFLLWKWLTTGGKVFKKKDRGMPSKLLSNYNHKHALLPSGVNMHYVEAGEQSAPLMVLIHGFPEFWYTWRFQIEHFKDRYRVVAVDQRGYGESTKPPKIADYSQTLLAKDIDDLIHELGYSDAVVVGHDWGAFVAWAHAILFPKSVRRLIICNVPHQAAFGHLLKTNDRQWKMSWYMFFFQSPCVPEALIAADDFKSLEEAFWSRKDGLRNKANFTSEDMEAWKHTFSEPDCLRSAINYYRCKFQYPEDYKYEQKCTVKTLILWGEEDPFLVKEGATLSAHEWCEDATLHFIPGASHWIQQDEPDVVNKHIDEFLRA
ncbi:hypothetical protein PMAYCL1PPCAC_19657, partial [Pristionchus mayeri]